MAAAGGILILLGLCPMLASLVALIPQPVLGGVGIVLDSGISTGCVVAVLLNLAFNHVGHRTETPTDPAAAPHLTH